MSLDLDKLLRRTGQSYEWINGVAYDGFLPLYLRDHFNYDVPALISAVKRLQVELAAANGMLDRLTADEDTR